jgi:hypothetical protein
LAVFTRSSSSEGAASQPTDSVEEALCRPGRPWAVVIAASFRALLVSTPLSTVKSCLTDGAATSRIQTRGCGNVALKAGAAEQLWSGPSQAGIVGHGECTIGLLRASWAASARHRRANRSDRRGKDRPVDRVVGFRDWHDVLPVARWWTGPFHGLDSQVVAPSREQVVQETRLDGAVLGRRDTPTPAAPTAEQRRVVLVVTSVIRGFFADHRGDLGLDQTMMTTRGESVFAQLARTISVRSMGSGR